MALVESRSEWAGLDGYGLGDGFCGLFVGGLDPPEVVRRFGTAGGERMTFGEMNGLVAEYVAHTRCAAACLREGSRVEKRDTAVGK
ncbi:hypothetical protein [Amycolatopsis echigonensis]|uniref:Uncharacterized protein n=1 Tax=Amycolatopsis echigonensis TaxID=2576905 RepID=A0A8E1VRI4_9PSEU|nr:hypothetical protein [Amycolatopsis echigonensis]MBB2497541.1 hypothetical protein [Amycolatopsis echigonensis]